MRSVPRRKVKSQPSSAYEQGVKVRAERDLAFVSLAGLYWPCAPPTWSAMTRPLQKRRERIFVEEAGRLLGKTWVLGDDREHPDFIVVENGKRFGLEVTQIFIGPQSDAGSFLKAT